MLRRLSVDRDCNGDYDCPSVWQDDGNPEELLIIGAPVEPGIVPTGPGEAAIRIRWQVVSDARTVR